MRDVDTTEVFKCTNILFYAAGTTVEVVEEGGFEGEAVI